ncbi:hypothetical protein ACTFIY_008268 [Dictyostelium cf. discoideum]
MSDIDERKQAIYEKFQKVLNEKEKLGNESGENKEETNVNNNNNNDNNKNKEKDIQENDDNPILEKSNRFESDILLEKRRRELEKEINEINQALNKKGSSSLTKSKPKESWYTSYPKLNSFFSHPDFRDWQKFTSIMSIAGLVMGGLHGYSEGKKYIRESIAKSIHSPLSISSVQLNQRKTLGIMVFRSSLIFSYRCGLYTATFLGTEYLLKNNVFGESLLNRTLAGTAIGVLSAFHMRKRGNLVVPISICMGTTIGFFTGCADLLVDKSFRKIEQLKKESENK